MGLSDHKSQPKKVADSQRACVCLQPTEMHKETSGVSSKSNHISDPIQSFLIANMNSHQLFITLRTHAQLLVPVIIFLAMFTKFHL